MQKRTELKIAMRESGMTGRYIAKKLQISESRFSQILSGAPIKESQIKMLCELLKISADVIIFNSGSQGGNPPEREYIELFRHKLSAKAQLRLIQMLREL